MIEELGIFLEKYQSENHTLGEMKEFVHRDEFRMKEVFKNAPENCTFSILYDSLITTIPFVDDINSISRKALSDLSDPFLNWVEIYASEYEAMLLAHFSFTIMVETSIQSDYIPVFFPIWNIHKEDLRDAIQFLKIYAIKSDYHLLDNELELMNLLEL